MRLENTIQLKEQDLKHLKDQIIEKKEQINKLKLENENKIRHLEGSKGKLLNDLRKDFDEEKIKMKRDYDEKKKSLKEKVLNLTSIISQKEQEIDSHLSNIKNSHKELVREKERHQYEKKKFVERLENWELMKEQLTQKSKDNEDLSKRIKKLEHKLLSNEQNNKSLKSMYENEKKFWDELYNDEKRKNEKLNLEMANVIKNSLQNKSSEEEMKKLYNKKIKKFNEDLEIKEQNFKNKYQQNLKAFEKNKAILLQAKQKLEIEKKNLIEKMKNLEKLNFQVIELKSNESRLIERLEMQEKKYKKESLDVKDKINKEINHKEKRIRMLESKLENLEDDNKKKQKQLLSAFNQNNAIKNQLEKQLTEKTDKIDNLQRQKMRLEKKVAFLQVSLQNKNSVIGVSSINNILKTGLKNDKSGLFSDNISESYTTNGKFISNQMNISRYGLTPVKRKSNHDNSAMDTFQNSSSNILED